jgi:hypothetical protein
MESVGAVSVSEFVSISIERWCSRWLSGGKIGDVSTTSDVTGGFGATFNPTARGEGALTRLGERHRGVQFVVMASRV